MNKILLNCCLAFLIPIVVIFGWFELNNKQIKDRKEIEVDFGYTVDKCLVRKIDTKQGTMSLAGCVSTKKSEPEDRVKLLEDYLGIEYIPETKTTEPPKYQKRQEEIKK